MAKLELELISDADIYLFFEKVWEGGFPIFPKNIVKPTKSNLNLMT